MRFLSTVCIAALGSALFRILVPEGKFSRQVSALIAGAFLLAGITAFRGADLELEVPEVDIAYEERREELTEDVYRELKQRVCSGTEEKISALLSGQGIYPEEIHVIVNISGLYSIDITQVKLVFASGDTAAAEAAAECLKNELSPDIAIYCSVG